MILPPKGFVATEAPEFFSLEGVDPYLPDRTASFQVSVAMLRNLEETGIARKFLDACLIPYAVERPTVILEGLRRENYGDGFCYCTVPPERPFYDERGEIRLAAPPPKMIFAVYVMSSRSGLLVLDWDWRRVSSVGTGIPDRWQRDFERVLWPTS
jgi:hypothetical protein